jgi:DNA primase
MRPITYASSLLEVIAGDLGKGRQVGARPFWCCPFHDDKTPSLTICPDGKHWKCFGCGKSGDAIDWVRAREGLSFQEAVQRLGGQHVAGEHRRQPGGAKPGRTTIAAVSPTPDGNWQRKASEIVECAQQLLWSPAGARALDWLRARGLLDTMSKTAKLGLHPRDGKVAGLYVDRGIMIPWFEGDELRFVQVRRPVGKPKYRAIEGGTRGAFYPAPPKPGRPMLVVEGEFDALLGRQQIGDLIEVVTLGGASQNLSEEAVSALTCAPVVLVATDANAAGASAARQWLELTARAIRLKPPIGIDLTESYLAGVDLRAWIGSELDKAFDRATRIRASRSTPALSIATAPTPTSASRSSSPLGSTSCLQAEDAVSDLPGLAERDPMEPTIVRDAASLSALSDVLAVAEEVVVDLETSGLDHRAGEIVGIGIAVAERTFYVPIGHRLLVTNALQPDQLPLAEVLQSLKLEDRQLIADNAKFEFKWLLRHGGITCTFSWDTMLASRLLNSSEPAGLKEIAARELNVPDWSLSPREISNMAIVPIETAARYCAKDVWYTLLMKRKQAECRV